MKRNLFAAICIVTVLSLCIPLWGFADNETAESIYTRNNNLQSDTASEEDDLEWWQKTIAYEIYVKSFKDSDGDGIGDLNGITSELDYLKDLGVGIIWLTPCYVSPQADNGYDVADYYNIDPAYGTMDDMEHLIEEAGKRDIRIVMDLVFNHTSDENEWFQESRSSKDNDKSDWYIWKDPKEDGSAPTNWRSIFGGSAWEYDETRGQYYLHTFLARQPDLNWENPEVRQALADVANFWVEKGVGGFRMDAIVYIKKPEEFLDGTPDYKDGLINIHTMTANTEGILDYLQEFKSSVQDGTDIFTVGEANGVSDSELPKWVGKDGVLDMIFEFSHVNIDLPGEMNWCDTREWKLTDLKNIFSDSQNTTNVIHGWYPMFLENHDQPRSINRYLSADTDRVAGGKALAALLLTMRGTPFIMEGEELGFVNVEWPSIDDYEDISTRKHYEFALKQGYTEEEAMAAVHRFSRDSARTPVQWDDSDHAGFTTGTPWLPVYDDYTIFNAASERNDPDSVLNWYITLAQLRKEHSELVDGKYRELFQDNENIFAYVRENSGAKAIVLINFTTKDAVYDASCLENAELIISSCGQSTKGVLAPMEAVIYEVKNNTSQGEGKEADQMTISEGTDTVCEITGYHDYAGPLDSYFLKEGDKIAVISPSSLPDREKFDATVNGLKEWGYEPVEGKYVCVKERTLDNCLEDLLWALNDSSVKAIFCVRGGYAASEVMDHMPQDIITSSKKLIIGYSDITVYHSAWSRAGLPSIQASMSAAFMDLPEDCVEAEQHLMKGQVPEYRCPVGSYDKKGSAEGILIGGNLATMTAVLSTVYDCTSTDQPYILFLEDVDEDYEHIHRYLTVLQHFGVLDKAAGIIFGEWVDYPAYCESYDGKSRNGDFTSVADMISREFFSDTHIPVAFGFPAGHGNRNYPLLMGVNAQLVVTDQDYTLVPGK